MGRSRYKIYDDSYPYFITSTFVKWYPLFSDPKIAEICIKSIQYAQQNLGLHLYGWVLMENHMHLIVKANDLGNVVSRMKSFTARAIVDYLKEVNKSKLNDLEWAKLDFKIDQDFQVWQEGFHPEQINSREVMENKIAYIHMNPVKRGYVDKPEYWRYSSMGAYIGHNGLLDVICNW